MDTLFRLVSLQSSDHHQQQQQQQQQSSFNSSSRTSTSSRSSKAHHQQQQQQQQQAYLYFQQQQYQYSSTSQEEEEEECNNHHLYMDEDFSSSSSSKAQQHFLPTTSNPNPNPSPNPNPPPSGQQQQQLGLNLLDLGPRWATDVLTECARAVASRDTQKVQQLMWMLNELSSPYGDTDQKLAAYFLQALFARLTSSGPRTLRTLSSASDRTASFDSTRRVALRFQDLSPWSCFGHVAANGAILESFLNPPGPDQRLHILDLSNTFCTQWPTLLEALATRSADTPHLTITTVVSSSPSSSSSSSSSSVHRVMKEISARMEKFARLMGVPFAFNVVHHAGDLSTLDLGQLDLSDAALAINCVNALHGVSPSSRGRDSFLASLCRLRPRIVTVVEEEADLGVTGGDDDDDEEEGEAFLKGFRESLRFFSAYFDSLEECFPKTSNERLALERTAGRAVMDLVACPASESAERRDTARRWSARMREAGFVPTAFSDDVADDVRALLRRYREGWSMDAADPTGVMLAWKEQPMVWASAWKLVL